MQVHEIKRSEYMRLLNNLDWLPTNTECSLYEQSIDNEYVVVNMPVSFGKVYKYGSVFIGFDNLSDAIERVQYGEDLENRTLKKDGRKIWSLATVFVYEIWHVINNEPDDDVYVCYSVIPFFTEQNEDVLTDGAGEIEFESYEQALCCAKNLVNISNPEGYKGIPYQTKMFHHVALTRNITDCYGLREIKTLCVLMPRMNRKYRGMKILGCEVNRYPVRDLEVAESLCQLREAAVM